MPDKIRLLAQIENAAENITPFWPLKTFIATNPLAGLEDMPFEDAIEKGAQLYGGNGLPTRAMGQQAIANGHISTSILKDILQDNNQSGLYNAMLSEKPVAPSTATIAASPLNATMIKYLAAFLDEGQSGWQMPGREAGFYKAWKSLAPHDQYLKDKALLESLPDKALDALFHLIKDVPDQDREALFEKHFAALPGWSGFAKWRSQHKNYPWQKEYRITLAQLLAVRLAMAAMLNDDGLPQAEAKQNPEGLYWLQAWEETYRQGLTSQLAKTCMTPADSKRPAAQFVFCIDVRSEVFRRHLEATGAYETYGFAGFFGVPIRHTNFADDIAADSCPVLLQPQFETTDLPCEGQEKLAAKHKQGRKTAKGFKAALQSLKNNMAASFAMVEASGPLLSVGMTARTFAPQTVKSINQAAQNWLMPEVKVTATTVKTKDDPHGLTITQRIFHAEAALKIMGLTKNFAPYIVLTGHGSETANNPYAAGLDCGACGGNHGGPNARVMADVFNDPKVRAGLKERGLDIPDDTIFLGAQHNTTTDHVEILSDQTPPDAISASLKTAQHTASQERAKAFGTKYTPNQRATDWAEVRPEWGLARNAAFIIGPRTMTKSLNLEGRSFLHSYDWEGDADGTALEIILTAPMVVAEWINTQYYFSTVDNAVYGSGSKTTHNVVGKIGVMQGNASDLMTGLPLQSVMSADGALYHEPLRLMTIVKAPVSRVTKIIAANDILQNLFNNNWVALTVIDPETGKIMRYGPEKTWQDVESAKPHNNQPTQNTETTKQTKTT